MSGTEDARIDADTEVTPSGHPYGAFPVGHGLKAQSVPRQRDGLPDDHVLDDWLGVPRGEVDVVIRAPAAEEDDR